MKLTKLLRMALLVGCLIAAPSVRAQDKPAGDRQPATPAQDKDKAAQPAPKVEVPMVYVLMKTSKGEITLELNQEKAPITVENFLRYVDKKFYDGTIFHRIINDFMIQGGGMEANFQEKKGGDKPIKNEWQNGLKNVKYSIAMARVGGQPDSASSQFFINVKDNPMLDRKQPDGAAYCAFGRVVAGFDVVDKIKAVDVVMDPRGEKSKPVEQIKVESTRRLTPEETSAIKAKLSEKK